MGITSRLAEFVLHTSFEDLPSEVVVRCKDMMLNAAAVALAGAAQPEGQALTSFAQEMRGNGKCTIIGMGLRTSPVYAALANGVMVHLLDFDDEVIGCGSHPTSCIFPVVIALGEMNGYSGKKVLAAFALGCEVATKLGALAGLQATGCGLQSLTPVPTSRDAPSPSEMERGLGGEAHPGWHLDGIFGTIGATAAAGKLLGLDQTQLENAFGIAAGAAGGVWANFGTPAESFQYGRAAMNGVVAAMLAQKGFTAARGALEDPGGLLDCCLPLASPPAPSPSSMGRGFGGEAEEAFFAQLGNPYQVVHPGIALKVYPCEAASHATIDAVLQLRQQYRITPGQVASVGVSVTPQVASLLPCSHPRTGWEARVSLEYVVAVALVDGQPLIDHFTDGAVGDSRLQELMARVAVTPTEIPTKLIPRPSTVTLTLANGRVLCQRVDFARGHPELPLTAEELNAKFLYCTRYILPPDHIEGAIGQFRDLENIQDITALASILGG
jgi:2-methylcitrate dehydratase PrpD